MKNIKYKLSNIKHKNLIIYLSFLLLSILIYTVFAFYLTSGDSLNNYGFSHAIRIGEVPYKDFNTVSTPLYSFFMSIPLFINDSYLSFFIFHTLITWFMFLILYKKFGHKVLIPILAISSMSYISLLPTYNFFELFLLILLIFLEEKENKNHYLIGLILSLLVLTKHTIGLFFVIPSLIYYFKDKSSLKKRIISFFIPITIFLTYLLITNSLYNFLDLCFLGLFDFSSSNKTPLSIYTPLSILIFIYILYSFIKHKNNINYLYYLLSIFFIIPLCDENHFSIYIVILSLTLASNLKEVKDKDIIIFFITLFSLISIYKEYNRSRIVIVKDLNHLNYTINFEDNYNTIKNNQKIINKYKNNLLITYSNMSYHIINNHKIDYFSVLCNGNYGYNGTKKMINKIKNNKENKYIIISYSDYVNNDKRSQFTKELVRFVMNNYELISKEESYYIYLNKNYEK